MMVETPFFVLRLFSPSAMNSWVEDTPEAEIGATVSLFAALGDAGLKPETSAVRKPRPRTKRGRFLVNMFVIAFRKYRSNYGFRQYQMDGRLFKFLKI
mmetsp:Transcript_19569/g.40359  ORF Transcript_19569/g.40359 Transcript_19569/m.40359 type:complete len:98 (-) Transcript_19569:357-650(-)